jgi:hypothetical protein
MTLQSNDVDFYGLAALVALSRDAQSKSSHVFDETRSLISNTSDRFKFLKQNHKNRGHETALILSLMPKIAQFILVQTSNVAQEFGIDKVALKNGVVLGGSGISIEIPHLAVSLENIVGICPSEPELVRLPGIDVCEEGGFPEYTETRPTAFGWFPEIGTRRWTQLTRFSDGIIEPNLAYLIRPQLLITYSCYKRFIFDQNRHSVSGYLPHSSGDKFDYVSENERFFDIPNKISIVGEDPTNIWRHAKDAFQIKFYANRKNFLHGQRPEAFFFIACSVPLCAEGEVNELLTANAPDHPAPLFPFLTIYISFDIFDLSASLNSEQRRQFTHKLTQNTWRNLKSLKVSVTSIFFGNYIRSKNELPFSQ